MVDASGLPGICRSNTGVAETDEPCTKSTLPRRVAPSGGSRSCLRHRNSLTLSAPTRLVVQCSVPRIVLEGGPSPRAVSAGAAAAAKTAAATPKNSRRDAGSRLSREVMGRRCAALMSLHFGTLTSVTVFTRLLASTKLPSGVTEVLRTMLPPPGIAQVWNFDVFGSKRTTVFGDASDSLYQITPLITEMP